jgi:hypothetical protein
MTPRRYIGFVCLLIIPFATPRPVLAIGESAILEIENATNDVELQTQYQDDTGRWRDANAVHPKQTITTIVTVKQGAASIVIRRKPNGTPVIIRMDDKVQGREFRCVYGSRATIAGADGWSYPQRR